MLKRDKIKEIAEKQTDFSGVVSIETNDNIIFKGGYGFANRSYRASNNIDTKFGIASGAKLFTAIAIGQLVDRGLITFDTYIKDVLDISFPNYDPNVKVKHLLTHSSGIKDYLDEEEIEDFSEMWNTRPMYRVKGPRDYLPMIRDKGMEFIPGEKFKYNNSGFILLALIVEEVSKVKFIDYVNENILKACNMNNSGYYFFDKLPENTAYGYIKEESGQWKTNIYSLPIVGCGDGGIYSNAKDLSKLWRRLLKYRLLKEETTKEMLKPHINIKDNFYYGYGVWITMKDNEVFKYYIMGHDMGVSMISSIYPKNDIIFSVIGNTEFGTWDINRKINDLIKA